MNKILLSKITRRIRCAGCRRYFSVSGRPLDVICVVCPFCKKEIKVVI